MIKDNDFNIKNCWINLYKPCGINSSACTFKIRYLLTKLFRKFEILKLDEKLKCGHLGTLDPMAEGVLPIAIGEASKTIQLQENRKKRYIFTVLWGKQTDSDDDYGNVIKFCQNNPTDDEIRKCIKYFVGEIFQTPNRFSAVHINGIRAYKLARLGKSFDIPVRKIIIDNLELIKSWSECEHGENLKYYSEFSVTCSTGTYVRSLAHDIADKLGTCGCLVKLVRTENSVFNISESVDYEKLLDFLDYFIHTGECIRFDSVTFEGVRVLDILKPVDYGLDDTPVIFVKNKYSVGKFINGSVFDADYLDGLYRVYVNDRTLVDDVCFIGIAEVKSGKIYPKRVFNLFKRK